MCITHRLGIIKSLWFVTVEIIKCLWFGVPAVFFFRAIENWLFVYLFCSILGMVCGVAWRWPWGYACQFSAVMALPAGKSDSRGILGAWRGGWEGKEKQAWLDAFTRGRCRRSAIKFFKSRSLVFVWAKQRGREIFLPAPALSAFPVLVLFSLLCCFSRWRGFLSRLRERPLTRLPTL